MNIRRALKNYCANMGKTPSKKYYYIFGFVIFAIFQILPFIIFGKASIITIHDNLDILIPFYKMFRDDNLFFKFNVATNGFSNMSSIYYGVFGYTFQSLIFYFLPTFIAYAVNHFISVILGFGCMFLFLKKIRIKNYINFFIALIFSILPVVTSWSIAVSTIPLIILIFIYYFENVSQRVDPIIALMLFYPFFSYFTAIGIFIIGFWLLGSIFYLFRYKRINKNLVIGLLLLILGYVVTDIQLFYSMFIVRVPLNRSIFLNSESFITSFKCFKSYFKEYFLYGSYHAPSLQTKIILPIIFGFIVSSFILYFIRKFGQTYKYLDIVRKNTKGIEQNIKNIFILFSLVIFNSLIGALYDSKLIQGIVSSIFPFLTGFNWGRIWIFNRFLWYVLFALVLNFVNELATLNFNPKIDITTNMLGTIVSKIIEALVVFVLLIQLVYTSIVQIPYNDSAYTWANELLIQRGLAERYIDKFNFDDYISYDEFFAPEFFNSIKDDVSYTDERVIAVGFHPSVLMYNGFNCIDGYNNAYPLSYMMKFRNLIAPEFVVNTNDRDYYDSWGGRMYVYNKEISYVPTKKMDHTPIELRIDKNIFRDEFNGVYIFSRAEILNSEMLDLKLVKIYSQNEGIYTIFLYKTVSNLTN